MIFHTVYEIKISTPSGVKFYYGKHSTDDINDSYMGSGNYVRAVKRKISKSIEEYKLEKTILKVFDSEAESFDYEKKLISEKISDSSCVNMAIGGLGGQKGVKRSSETIKRMKLAKSGVNHPLFGTKRSNKTNERCRQTWKSKNLVPWKNSQVINNPIAMKTWSLCDKIYCIWKENELKYTKTKLKAECFNRNIEISKSADLDGMVKWFRRGNNPQDFVLPTL